jgi:hypothetical protein
MRATGTSDVHSVPLICLPWLLLAQRSCANATLSPPSTEVLLFLPPLPPCVASSASLLALTAVCQNFTGSSNSNRANGASITTISISRPDRAMYLRELDGVRIGREWQRLACHTICSILCYMPRHYGTTYGQDT